MLSTQSCPLGLDREPALSAALSAISYPARLRSRYLILFTRAAATAQRYNDRIVGTEKAFAELLLWKHDLRSMPPQAFVRHRRPISYVLASDASDHALRALIRQSSGTLLIGYKFYRRLELHERTWSSCLREMTGYDHGFPCLSHPVDLRDTGVEILGDHLACEVIFAHGGTQRAEENGDLLITERLIEILTLVNHVGGSVGTSYRTLTISAKTSIVWISALPLAYSRRSARAGALGTSTVSPMTP